jgi:predicted Fe-S protein YdhL (DUF1289 family)
MNAIPRPGVASPCVNVCRMDEASGWCLGCRRTLEEIAQWSVMDDEAKRAVWCQLRQRRAGRMPPVTPAEPGAPA